MHKALSCILAINKRRRLAALIVCALLALAGSLIIGDASSAGAQDYDIVILNGRVIDPESKLDAVRNVAVGEGKIQAISAGALSGRVRIDAKGLVVSPGFIDLHSHDPEHENDRYRVMDGVTTAFELEVGTADVDGWYARREGKSLINYGVSIGHIPVRMELFGDRGTFLPSGDGGHRAASDADIEELKRRMARGLERGAVAVGFGIAYTPAASRWEVLEMFRVAAGGGAPCHVHLRYAGEKEPTTNIQALEEVIAAAAITGTPLHVVHIQSTGGKATPRLLQMIADAQSRGLDITTECYPYTAGMTRLDSAQFDDGWQEMFGIGYQDLQWVATGERLTAESFARYRKLGGEVIIYRIPEDVVMAAVASPLTMIASDSYLIKGKGHPRTAGTYSRILGRYVREAKALSLIDALRKMTLMPAQRLERRAPMMKNKGRIRVGADADLVVFDPERIIDGATYEEPAKYPEGIRHVLVNGALVVRDGRLQSGIAPGRPVRAPIK